MNKVQEAIAEFTGVASELREQQIQLQALDEATQHLESENALLVRQIEDLDYLNLFELNQVTDILNLGDRKKIVNRLRRLRHENPLAKQAIKLTLRFTFGKGIQYLITASPDQEPAPSSPVPGAASPASVPSGSGKKPGFAGGVPLRATKTEADPELPKEKSDSKDVDAELLREIIEDFWEDDDNRLALTSKEAMVQWLDDILTDGEKFFACFEGGEGENASPYVKLVEIPVEEIEQVIYHPDNRMKPLYYRRQWTEMTFDGENDQYRPSDKPPKVKYYLDYRITDEDLKDVKGRIKIPSGKQADKSIRIFHSLVNPVWSKRGRRGISELFASREWFRVFKEFVEDRAAINAAATAVAYRRKIRGGPVEVAKFDGKFGGLDVGYDSAGNQSSEAKKLTRPVAGAVYNSNPAVDLEWMKTDTGAVNASLDARMLLMSAGAGVGTNIHYFGEGGDANLATAQAMELPMVKSYEDWQQFVQGEFTKLLLYVLGQARDPDSAKDDIKRVAFIFPPIISQDVVKYMTAWSQMVTNIASGNRAVQEQAIRGGLTVMGVANIDGLMPGILQEMERAELEKQAQAQAMQDALAGKNSPDNPLTGDGNGKGPPNVRNRDGKSVIAGRDGSSNALDPKLKRVAVGKPPAEK